MLKLCKINACPNGTLGLHLSRAPWDPYPWVSGVQDGSNAYQAGVRSGDSVLELNGSDVLGQKISEMAKKIQSHWAGGGSIVTILIWRNKTENNPVNQQSLQKFAKCLQQIAQLLECPICLEIVKPPGWQCCNGHVLCNSCRGRTVKCPICRVTLGPRGRCLLSDKLFTLLAESFPCDGVKNSNSPSDYNDCHEKPLISVKIDRPPSSALSSATLDKVQHRKQIAGHTILGHLKKSDDDNSQLGTDDDNSTSPDDNIVLLKRNLKSQKKSDFMEHGSCYHRHHHHQQHQHQQQQLYHHHRSHSHHGRQLLGQQQHQRTFHCPTGKSSCLLLHNATDGISSSNNFGPDPDTKTLNRIWTQEVPFRKSKGDQKIETLAKLITEWDVLSHLTQVHQISVAQHYTTFGQPVRLQFAVNTKSMPCITIQSERTCIQNKENFKNNVNVSVGGVFLPTEGIENNQGHTLDRRHKNARMTSVPKDVHRPATELFFVACMPLDSDEDTEMCVHQEGLRNEMHVVSADARGVLPPPPSCLAHEFDDAAVDLPVFVGLPNGPSAGAGVIKTPTKSKSTRESTYSQTTGHLIQDPGSELPSTTWQSRVNVERSPISSRCVCTNSSKVDACTWCTSSSSSSSSTSSSSLSCSSSLASFSMCSSSYRCCSNTTTLQHAIFIWYFGSESDVKNFQTVIECKRTGLKWTGCVHPLTTSWSSIRSAAHMQQFLVLNSMPDGGDNFFDIVIKIK